MRLGLSEHPQSIKTIFHGFSESFLIICLHSETRKGVKIVRSVENVDKAMQVSNCVVVDAIKEITFDSAEQKFITLRNELMWLSLRVRHQTVKEFLQTKFGNPKCCKR